MTGKGLALEEIVARLGGSLRGDGRLNVNGVGALASAGPDELSFLANPRYRMQLDTTRAGCVILRDQDAKACPTACIVTEDPYVYYARAAQLIVPAIPTRPGIHPEATVGASARVDPGAWIGPRAVVGEGAIIEAGAFVGPGCILDEDVEIGAHTRLLAGVTVLARARIGSGCTIHPGVVIGGDGFGIAWDGEIWIKVPQLGSVRIGDNVEIGANTTIDRGAIEDTIIEEGVKLDNLIQVGHNVRIGAHTVIAACTGISGTTTIGSKCQIGGQVGFAGHLTIADGTIVTGKTFVNHSIHRAGRYSGALPMEESERWRMNSARFSFLNELARRIARVERKIKED